LCFSRDRLTVHESADTLAERLLRLPFRQAIGKVVLPVNLDGMRDSGSRCLSRLVVRNSNMLLLEDTSLQSSVLDDTMLSPQT
jgi:hypothetical protein